MHTQVEFIPVVEPDKLDALKRAEEVTRLAR